MTQKLEWIYVKDRVRLLKRMEGMERLGMAIQLGIGKTVGGVLH